MKTVPAPLQTLIEKQVTTLAYMWTFTRKDGLVFYFTDHDRKVLFDGNWYEALTGFTRSTLIAKGDLSVDNTDVEALYDSGSISEEDLRKGLWDFAEYQIFLVDWSLKSISNTDKIILRRGYLGQVSLAETQFQVEQRGLTQALSVVLGDVYSPLCRVDLFSPECSLSAASWKQSSSVASATNRRKFVAEAKLQVEQALDFADAEQVEVLLDATAATATYDSQTPDGTAAHPYQVSTPAEVDAIRDNPRSYFVLTQNINMAPWGNWTPIAGFQGNLDGRGYEIQNIDLEDATQSPQIANGEWGWGFFADIGEQGVVRRLGLVDVDVDPGVAADSKCYLGTFVGLCLGRIEDCYVDGGNVFLNNNFYAAGGFGGRLAEYSPILDEYTPGPSTRATVVRCWSSVTLRWSGLGSGHGGFFGTVGGALAQAKQTGCYWDSDVAGLTQIGSGCQSTALTTAQMKQSSNYPEFDFANDWVADDGVDMPRYLEPGRGNGSDESWLRFPAILLTFAGTYSSSVINWTATTPGASAITVEASKDGDTWSACTSGVEIPGFIASDNLAGVYLHFRVNFVEDGTDLPVLETMDFSVTGQADAFDADALADDDWFKPGHLKWTSGLNVGIAMEVKSWSATAKQIVLYLEMPFDITVGDAFDIYPGCQKRILEDCRDKFDNVLNFRGEPNVPGTDQMMRWPDAPE